MLSLFESVETGKGRAVFLWLAHQMLGAARAAGSQELVSPMEHSERSLPLFFLRVYLNRKLE